LPIATYDETFRNKGETHQPNGKAFYQTMKVYKQLVSTLLKRVKKKLKGTIF
jgi:hypothetical protein